MTKSSAVGVESPRKRSVSSVFRPTFLAAANSGLGARFGLTGGVTPTEPPGRTPAVPASRGSLRLTGRR
jgi:hypothetical protein